MKILTKEKSKQKRKCVNNQNNSASYFRLLTPDYKIIMKRKLIFVNQWSEKG